MDIEVNPYTYTKTKIITKVNIDIESIEFNKKATFKVYLYDCDDNIITCQTVFLEGSNYENWGTDDNYVIDYIFDILKLNKKMCD